MAKSIENTIKLFKGIRNDENAKQIDPEYFFKIINWNYPDTGILGLTKILMPERFKEFGADEIDGLYEFRYLDGSNDIQVEYIVVCNGTIYKTDLVSTAVSIGAFFSAGKVSFTVFNDRLYMANGKDHIKVYDGELGLVKEIGAPFAEATASVGNPNGTYYYAISYVLAGSVEETIGTISNVVTVSNKVIRLHLPIGYSGTEERKIYRTTNGGSTLKLLATVENNTDLTYDDNIADASLGADIIAANNEQPKPYFLSVAGQKLFGYKTDNYPTQVFPSETNIEYFDTASFIDVSNYGDRDNTAVEGGGVDFNKVVIGTGKNMYLVDPIDNSVVITRANVGIKNGYSCKSLPAFGDFPGGLMFLSSQNDVRLMSGMQSIPVSTSLDNVRTENWAQQIRGDLESELKTLTNVCSEFYKSKYHLVLNKTKFVFDIRTQGWTEHKIKTDTYESQPTTFGVLNGFLYNGQPDGWVEKEYTSVQYRSEDVEAYLQSAYIGVDRMYKFIEAMSLWFIPSVNNELTVTVVTDDNQSFSTTQTFSVLAHKDFVVLGGAYNSQFFSKLYFDVDLTGMDYRKVNINQNCRWFQWTLVNKVGNISLQGVSYIGQPLENKE